MPPIEVKVEDSPTPRSGLILLYALVVFLFILFIMRFWYLQILNGEEFSRQALSNRTRAHQVYATRGILLDLKGRLLAENRPAYCIAIIREDCPDIPATLAQISVWTGIPLDALENKFNQDKKDVQAFEPQLLTTDIPFEQVIAIEQELYQWPGLTIVTRQRRFYPYTNLLAHILGYVAEANSSEVNQEQGVALGDRIGKLGLEYILEQRLRGTKGRNIVEVDAHSRQIAKVQEDPPIAGENFTLSLDLDLQKAATAALGEEAGSVIVMEPDTGKVRALVTQPAFDNNLFTAKLSAKDWAALRDHPRHPMQNRSIQSVYPPGSVWKLMMAGLFLEQGINPQATVHCSGSVTLGNRTFRCWKKGGHGTINMMASLINSCDVYYYEMSQRVGIDNIERFAKACGFGKPTGVDLPHERSGLVPGKAWKRARNPKDPSWQRGETLNVSIGQGYTLVTPIQMAVFLSALLNEGKLVKPSLLENEQLEVTGELPMPAAHRSFILEGMRATASYGTARVINRKDAIMGGKTGTAQVVRIGDTRLTKDQMEYLHRDHAWLTSFAIKDGKTYVMVVMVEHGGGGSSTAGPVSAKVYNALLGPPPGYVPPPPPTPEEEEEDVPFPTETGAAQQHTQQTHNTPASTIPVAAERGVRP